MDVKCTEFVANAWKKDLCVNCQRHQTEHRAPATAAGNGIKVTVPSISAVNTGKQVSFAHKPYCITL